MNHERYFQYTKGWTEIKLTNPQPRMLDWCHRHQSIYGYHTMYNSKDSYTLTSIRFESKMDAMQFAMAFIE